MFYTQGHGQEQGGEGQYGGYGGSQGGHDQYGAPPTQYDQGHAANPNYSQGGYGPAGSYPPGNQPGNYDMYQGGMPQSAQGAQASLLQKSATPEWGVAFFAAACSIMLGALIGGITLFFSFELVDFIEMCYMFCFAGVLAVLDTPCFKSLKAVKDYQEYFTKYVNLLTRVTGKGITFIFLGCALFSGMWDNLEGVPLLFISFVLCLLPVVLGFVAVAVASIKSWKLNKAKLALLADLNNVPMLYEQYARTYPGQLGGLTQLEFNDLTNKFAGMKWETSDLKLIFNALVSNPAWRTGNSAGGMGNQPVEMAKLPKEDFLSWVKGSMVWL
eukprot:TRINITY_DN61263_c0_g1_i1.p1 TRINITY_DN61263_c0_g1~~TRINITY_DN61263_c0_g1_i1.p1  ORF type:complete len:328 (+),score=68.34 TRINITY_DN61263_c0_g1_i1:87-1070(+)